MPVSFLSASQRESYGQYVGDPSAEELARYFHLDDTDHAMIANMRGDGNRLGFALQLTTVRFLGTFLEAPTAVPPAVLSTMTRQLGISRTTDLSGYREGERRWDHAAQIRVDHGYRDFADRSAGFGLTRWLYALCWTGTERPSVLFERATAWLIAHKVLLPGASVLERFVARLRSHVEARLWRVLGRDVTDDQCAQLEGWLAVPAGERFSRLDQLRSGPVMVSAPALVRAIDRLQSVRQVGITVSASARIPPSRLASLARFANTAKVTAVARLPPARRLATLVAFAHSLEASAQDDVLDVLDAVLHDIFEKAKKEDRRTRLRTIKDLDKAAATLARACSIILVVRADKKLRAKVFEQVSREDLADALQAVGALTRPPQDVFYKELQTKHRRVRRFLPAVLEHVRFDASPAGKAVVAALAYLRESEAAPSSIATAPRDVISKSWRPHVLRDDDTVDRHAYTFCVLDALRASLRRREVFVQPSWRYADPRSGLLSGAEWESARPMICRSLEYSPEAQPVISALANELDQTYRAVNARLPNNPSVRFETVGDETDLILTNLDKMEEPPSFIALRSAVAAMIPRADLPEILLEIAARTGFVNAFTHVSEHNARAADLTTSLCAVLLSAACNTGLEPLVRQEIAALRRDRMAWVDQNYVRDETLIEANACLVSAQNEITLAHAWGGGEVASADGLRFVVPVRTVHAGTNPKYFGFGRGVTYYNLISSQFTGLNAITVPGTLRDSLVLLAVVLEQQTEFQPTQIMTDTGAYSDVVFGLFRLLGYRFSPRIADVGGTRFWRIDPDADYGAFNAVARQRVNTGLIVQHWDDLLRLAGSLKLGRVPATGIMRTLQVGERPTRLARALAEFGRIEKTLHVLNFIDDEAKRRATLTQLNRGEGRHALARIVFHGKRGELRQHYRQGQEDQLGALGLVLNVIVLWNTLYIDAALDQLRAQGFDVRDEDIARLSPLVHGHINVLGRYSFAVPEVVARGELRPLRNPDDGP